MTRPVLGVDRIVGYSGIEPEAVSLFTVIEGSLDGLARAATAATSTPSATPLGAVVVGLSSNALSRGPKRMCTLSRRIAC